MRSPPTLSIEREQYAEPRSRRIMTALCITGILSCLIGVGLAALYFGNQVQEVQATPVARPPQLAPISLPRATPTQSPFPSVLASAPTSVPAAQAPSPIAPPQSGEIRTFTTKNRLAPFEVRTTAGGNYLVKLEDASSGRIVLSLFIQGGRTEKIQVPLGNYVVKYASGETWYGDRLLFGPSTQFFSTPSNSAAWNWWIASHGYAA